jgi:CRISPR/Cas system CMR subunit Cmr4 (Cas7 group RAMP superfamily)
LGKYLSFPLIQGRVKKDHFNFVIEKIKRRLSNWKMKMPNKAGRTTLAKLVLMALPVYSMQSFWLPKTTCLMINKTIRRFIWDSKEMEYCYLS